MSFISGQPQSISNGEALLNALGVKLQPYDAAALYSKRLQGFNHQADEIDRLASQADRLFAEGKITEDEHAARVERARANMDALQEAYTRWAAQADLETGARGR